MLRLASDADVGGAIIRGLRRREPAIDLLRSQDFLPKGTPDPEVLQWAARDGRVLVSNDRKTMIGFAYARIAAGEPLPGVIITTNKQPIGAAIAEILIIAVCMAEDEMRDQVVFLPL
jgi:hypothetical protein